MLEIPKKKEKMGLIGVRLPMRLKLELERVVRKKGYRSPQAVINSLIEAFIESERGENGGV